MKSKTLLRYSVIGLGRFGALWAKILLRNKHILIKNALRYPTLFTYAITDVEILVTDSILPSDDTLSLYEQEGLRWGDIKDAASSDAVFICVPISIFPAVLREIAPYLFSHTLVCDTCSVKVQPVTWMNTILSPVQPCMATHPLFGPDSYARKTDCPIALYPVHMLDTLFSYWQHSFRDMNMTPIVITPEEHDKQAAYSQGLTHLLGRTLEKLSLKREQIHTKGYNALLEIILQTCNDSKQLFMDLQRYNPASKEMWHAFQYALSDIIKELDASE